jgi:hypothetical protein
MSDDTYTEEDDLTVAMERMSLLPDRYYIILSPEERPDGGEGTFRLTAYDTTSKTYEKDEDFDAAMIMQEGVLSAIRERAEDLYDMGVASIKFKILAEEMLKHEDIPLPESVGENVVKVDFGKKQ